MCEKDILVFGGETVAVPVISFAKKYCDFTECPFPFASRAAKLRARTMAKQGWLVIESKQLCSSGCIERKTELSDKLMNAQGFLWPSHPATDQK